MLPGVLAVLLCFSSFVYASLGRLCSDQLQPLTYSSGIAPRTLTAEKNKIYILVLVHMSVYICISSLIHVYIYMSVWHVHSTTGPHVHVHTYIIVSNL